MGYHYDSDRTADKRQRTDSRETRASPSTPDSSDKSARYDGGSSYGASSYKNSSSHYSGACRNGEDYSRNGEDYSRRDAKRQRRNDSAIEKNFYVESDALKNMSTDDIEQYRSEHSMRILSSKSSCPAPLQGFRDIINANYIPDYLKQFLQKFEKPSPIQAQGWPVALSGRDLIGIAETGSGKTLAFLLPAIVHINAQPPLSSYTGGFNTSCSSPIALVLAPTRELACQIEDECKKIITGGNPHEYNTGRQESSSNRGAPRCVSLVGGVSKGPQIRDLKNGREIVVATPGRLLDLINMPIGFSLDRVSYLVLDEADRMLDMGFEKDLRKICSMIRLDKQTLLYSATWPKEVQKLATDLCTASHNNINSSSNQPVHIHIGEGELGELKANPRITQTIEILEPFQDTYKMQRVQQIVEELKRTGGMNGSMNGGAPKTVIFAMTKRSCDQLGYQLRSLGALAIHGDKTQYDRDWCLGEFKKPNSGYDILVATDVAARGLDVKNVECVINWDFPLNIEDYVHRIGRTGRAGKYGKAHSFFVEKDLKGAGPKSARDLVGILKQAGQEVSGELEALAAKAGAKAGGKGKGFGGKNRFSGGGKGGFSGGGKGFGKRY